MRAKLQHAAGLWSADVQDSSVPPLGPAWFAKRRKGDILRALWWQLEAGWPASRCLLWPIMRGLQLNAYDFRCFYHLGMVTSLPRAVTGVAR